MTNTEVDKLLIPRIKMKVPFHPFTKHDLWKVFVLNVKESMYEYFYHDKLRDIIAVNVVEKYPAHFVHLRWFDEHDVEQLASDGLYVRHYTSRRIRGKYISKEFLYSLRYVLENAAEKDKDGIPIMLNNCVPIYEFSFRHNYCNNHETNNEDITQVQ